MSKFDNSSAKLIDHTEAVLRSLSGGINPELQQRLNAARSASEELAQVRANLAAPPRQYAFRSFPHLPNGISSGKVAAFVAGAAVIAGGIHLLSRPRPEKIGWRERVEAERSMGSSASREI